MKDRSPCDPDAVVVVGEVPGRVTVGASRVPAKVGTSTGVPTGVNVGKTTVSGVKTGKVLAGVVSKGVLVGLP